MQLYAWLTSAASARGNSKALVYRDTYLSWRGLLHRVDRRAQELAQLGIQEGSWVGLMLGNVPDLVILALASAKLGATVVPIDPTCSGQELELILEAAPLRALVTRPRGAEPAGLPSPSAAARPPVLPSKFQPESRRRLQGTLLGVNLYRRSTSAVPSGALVPFTAMLAGDPQGVVRTDDSLRALAASVTDTLKVTEQDRLLCAMPLSQAYALDFGLLPSLATGATLFLEDELAAKRMGKLLRDHAITLMPATPALYGALARLPTIKPLEQAAAKLRLLSSGSALAPTIAETFERQYGVSVISCYHATQTGPVTADLAGRQPASVGLPFAGVEVKVADGRGASVPPGQEASVWVKTSGRGSGFVPKIHLPARPGETAVGGWSPDGWLRTGDLGRVDKQGTLFLTGREDDLVKVEGRRMALGEVRTILESFGKIKAAEVRVITDEIGAPMVAVRVVKSGLCRAEEVIDHCAKHLPPFKVPRAVEFCEALGTAS
jgi:long-chain acyl-CoA synthetase